MNRVRTELAAFLRNRRGRLRPTDVGLPDIGPRRTPGLRRQEVAQLAGISVEYYVRLEQARGPRPSAQVLSALARALLLTMDEREYLFRMAGENPPPVAGPVREVPVAIRNLLDTMPEPAYVLDAKYDVLAWNQLATYFISDLAEVPEDDRNIIRWLFRQPDDHGHWDSEDAVCFARACVADLRAALARYPGDEGIRGLVTELLGGSSRFAELWAEHTVQVRRTMVKRIDHELAGPVEFDCILLPIPDTDQRLIVYTAAADSPTYAAFQRLRTLSPAAPRSS